MRIINEGELYMKYKSTYYAALLDLSINMFLLYGGICVLSYFRNTSYVLFIIPIMSLMNIKTFMSLHDCGHNSYTPNKTLNYIIGTFTGIITFTSSWNWNLDHHTHHLTNGNINNPYKFTINETTGMSFNQYTKMNNFKKMILKILLYPYIRFSIIPAIYYGIIQRFYYIIKKLKGGSKIKAPLYVICFNHVINTTGMIYVIRYMYNLEILHHFICYIYISHVIGFLLFHNQHTFNPAYIVTNNDWNHRDSGIIGSSFIQIPYVIKYFFGGIEYHHIHHMNAKIPGYNLQKYHEEVVSKSDVFDNIIKLSMSDCYNNLWLVMYDEDNKRYITFAEADEQIRSK